MPSRVLVHPPPPDPPRLVDRPPRRPARGEEFPTGWTVADYQLERGEFAGEEYAYEVWVVPLLPVDEGPAMPDVVDRETGDRSAQPPPHGTLAAVPTLYGYELTAEDGERLVAALTDAGTHASLEAAAAIRWSEAMDIPVDDLAPELCRAILDVLDRATANLAPLRERLAREAVPPHPRTRRLLRSIHNPKRRACGCLDDCWCKRTAWGRVIRWYVPQKRHSSVSPCWKQTWHDTGSQQRL